MQKNSKAQLINGKVESILIKLTIPMVFGMVGMVIFNLVDTYYVGKLGTNQLAALTFTFPIILIINSLIMGIGIGTSSVISRAVGEENHHKLQRLGTDSLLLALILAVILVIIGLSSIDPIFKLLGVNAEVMPYVKQYMRIWYLGTIFVVVPMVGNNIIRALGDTKTPGMVMMISAGINVVLDPILIFGVGPFPEFGIAGAAIATVIARTLTFIVATYVLIVREKIVILEAVKIKDVISSWKQILYIGVPNGITKMVVPIASGVITGLIASYGVKAVAGYGIATRLEFFTLALINALSSVMGPFVGQNSGAKKIDRIRLGIKFSERFSIYYCAVLFAVLAIFARPIAGIFNKDVEVINNTIIYLRIVPLGYGLQGIFLIASSVLNALNKPMHASLLTVMQMFILYLPLAFIGASIFGIPGIFGGLVISYLITGVFAHYMVKKKLKQEDLLIKAKYNEVLS